MRGVKAEELWARGASSGRGNGVRCRYPTRAEHHGGAQLLCRTEVYLGGEGGNFGNLQNSYPSHRPRELRSVYGWAASLGLWHPAGSPHELVSGPTLGHRVTLLPVIAIGWLWG